LRANIELNIDELVLRGFSPGDKYRIGEAVKSELARLFSEHGVSPSLARGGDIVRIDGGSFKFTPGSKAEMIGAQVAQSVYRGLNR
jgi:hypothetical protein